MIILSRQNTALITQGLLLPHSQCPEQVLLGLRQPGLRRLVLGDRERMLTFYPKFLGKYFLR